MARFKQEVYDAYEKDAADRTFWEKIQAAYAGPLIEADKEKNKGSSVLPEDYLDFVEKLNLDVQDDINHYLNIFRNDNRPVLKHIDEIKEKGYSDYIPKGKFLKEFDDVDKFDKERWLDANYMGKGMYTAVYDKGAEGDEARQKIVNHPIGQIAVGPGHGLYTAARGTAELMASLSDLYLDTDTLATVERLLPEIDLEDVYGNESGAIAKFTSLLTQYGTGFAVAQKIAKKVIGKAVKTKLAQKAAKSAALQTTVGSGAANLAKYGGYWVLPAFVADTTVSATGQYSVGEIFGKEEGNWLQKALMSTKLEDIEGLKGKERAAAILRNKLKFGTEGTAFLGALRMVGPAMKFTGTGTGVMLREVVGPTLTGLSKVVGNKYTAAALKFTNKKLDKALERFGIPDSDLWKFSEFNWGTTQGLLKGLDKILANFKSGRDWTAQARNEFKNLEASVRAAKKSVDIFGKDLDMQMYKLAGVNASDILFGKATAQRALGHWDDVLKYMRGQIKLEALPKSLRPSAKIIRLHIDNLMDDLKPIMKDLDVKDDIIKNMGKYLHTSYKIFKNSNWRAPKEDYENAISYFVKLLRTHPANKGKSAKDLRTEATLKVNELLTIGRSEGTTVNQRLKAIVNAAEELKIPKNTFARFFDKEKLLPDEIGKLLGRVDDPKNIIMDTIAELAHSKATYNAYKELSDYGLGKLFFRTREDYLDFVKRNGIQNPKALVPVRVKNPNNLDLMDIFRNEDGTTMLTLPELAKAMSDTTLLMDNLLKLPFMKSALAFKAATQMNKTVLSLMTQMRNINTASMFAMANGHVGAGASVMDNFKILFDDLIGKTKNPAEFKKIINEALDAGAIDSSTIAQELEQMIPELLGATKTWGGKTLAEGKVSDQLFEYLFTKKGVVGRVGQKAIEAYQMGDNLWKLYGFHFVKSQLRPFIKNLDDVKKYFREVERYEWRPLKADGTKKTLSEAINEIAGLEIRDVYPNYSMIPTLVQNVRKTPFFGNFVAFSSEMWRNSFQINKRALRKLQSTSPYLQQIGARQMLGYITTVGTLVPSVMGAAKIATGITDDMYQAYKDRFAADYEKDHSMMPVSQQQDDHSWKASDLSALIPYADVLAPFKAAAQVLNEGGNTDQKVTDIYLKAVRKSLGAALEPFMSPSIFAETMVELTPNKDGQMRTKQGGLIADIVNDPDWISKMMYHAYKKLGPTTLISAEKIIKAIGGDLTKAGIQYDLWDEVVKNLTGFGIRKQDPYQSMRFRLGGYVGDMSDARAAFTNDIIHAGKLQDDAALIAQGLSPNNFNTEYDKLQSNNYRILSEVYKDVQALRELNFTEKEIKDLLRGRRALSKKDISAVMLGLFNPEEYDNLLKQNKSGLNKAIDQINKELGTFYKTKDFVNRDELKDIRRKWKNIPLGLTDIERQKYLDMPIESKLKEVLEPALKEREKLIEDQQEFEQKRIEEKIKRIEKTYEPKAQLPASPFIPDVDATITASLTPVIDQTTGLTRTESALLSPSEKVIAQRSNQGIMGLV